MSFKKVALAALVTIPASQAFGAEVSGNVALTSTTSSAVYLSRTARPLSKGVLMSHSTAASTLARGVPQSTSIVRSTRVAV